MEEAIDYAKSNNSDIGALIVKGNKIVSKGFRSGILMHAESNCMEKINNLNGCVLYSTCEPCAMCFYIAWQKGISKIVYGASLLDALKLGYKEIYLTADQMNKKSHSMIEIEKGILRKDCLKIMKKINLD